MNTLAELDIVVHDIHYNIKSVGVPRFALNNQDYGRKYDVDYGHGDITDIHSEWSENIDAPKLKSDVRVRYRVDENNKKIYVKNAKPAYYVNAPAFSSY